MRSSRLLLAGIGIAGLGGFGLGYLAGQSAKAGNAGDATSSSPSAARQPGHGDKESSPNGRSVTNANTNTKSTPKPRNATAADPVPNPEKGFSRRIVAMMSAGELAVSGVSIDGHSLLPGEKVKEFLDLTDEQLDTMKQMGRDRLRAKQEHERSLATILKATDQELAFEVPADPAFAAREKESFIEDLRKQFGPDVAAVLQATIGQAYLDFEHPRHVRLTRSAEQDDFGLSDITIGVNQNEDGTFMKDERGMALPNAHGLHGKMDLNNPEAAFSRYDYLWEREKGR